MEPKKRLDMKPLVIISLGALYLYFSQPAVMYATLDDSAAAIEQFTLFSKDRAPKEKKPELTPRKKVFKPETRKKTTNFIHRKYILRGTTILGKKEYAILQESGKPETFSVRLIPGRSTPLPEDPRYQLEDIEPRKVKLRYPLASPCKHDDPAKGIQCVENGKYALLSLVRMAPVNDKTKTTSPAPKKKALGNVIGSFPTSTKKTDVKKRNPFINPVPLTEEQKKKRLEKLHNDPAYQKRKEQYKNFKVRRIDKDDVPPGMKIQQTPFGDVLIPSQ